MQSNFFSCFANQTVAQTLTDSHERVAGPTELNESALQFVSGGLLGPAGTWAASAAVVQGPAGTW